MKFFKDIKNELIGTSRGIRKEVRTFRNNVTQCRKDMEQIPKDIAKEQRAWQREMNSVKKMFKGK